MPPYATALLTKDLARTLRSGHPWVYRDALSELNCEPGTIVSVREAGGRFVGRGIAEAGPIAVRLWTTKDEKVNDAFVRGRIETAIRLRRRIAPPDTNAIRLIHGEGDRLGGVVCDQYDDRGVLRIDGEGAFRFRDVIVDTLAKEARLAGVLLKRGRRGDATREVVAGTIDDAPLEVTEYGMRMRVDLFRGQKTGLFLDHRESRRVARRVAEGMRTLNLYGYTGGFSVAAGLGGARSVDTVDVAEGALGLANAGWADNGLGPRLHQTHAQDVKGFLEGAEKEDRRWDFIISDPPSFAPRQAARAAALKAYRALHRSCVGRLTDGGLYLAASCSSHVDREAFEQTLREGADRAGAVLQVLGRWGAAPDHPRLLAFPEGDYLTVVLARRM